MSLKFDATLKDLVQAYAADWLGVLDQPPTGPVEVLTPDLSTLTAFSDIVLRTGDALLHFDFQSGPDAALPRRVLVYNVLLHDSYDLPVHSVVILLRPRADRGDLTGTLSYAARPGRGRLEFSFEVIRLWQVPVERLLASGLGTLPLAVLAQMPAGRTLDEALPEVIARLIERIESETPAEQGRILLTATYVLMGLRLSRQRAIELFQGVRKMRDSDTYQAILDEGRAEGLIQGEARGRAEEARQLLLRLGRKRLGEPEATVEATVRAIDDLERLELLAERVSDVKSWPELLATA
jgi:predicted transposase YdaD